MSRLRYRSLILQRESRPLRRGLCDIGMASRDLKEEETGVTTTVIATDGIAVIVNNSNSIEGLSSEQVKGIFTGEITDWSEVQ